MSAKRVLDILCTSDTKRGVPCRLTVRGGSAQLRLKPSVMALALLGLSALAGMLLGAVSALLALAWLVVTVG